MGLREYTALGYFLSLCLLLLVESILSISRLIFSGLTSCVASNFTASRFKPIMGPDSDESEEDGGSIERRARASRRLAWACRSDDRKTLCLLLHLKADLNTSDYHGNGPLHIAAQQGNEDPRVLSGQLERKQVSLETEYTAAHLLFDHGANPCSINKEGKTAVQIWMEKNCGGKGMQSEAWKNRPYWCRETVPKLSCLAANKIHIHGIPFSRPGALPVGCLLGLENH